MSFFKKKSLGQHFLTSRDIAHTLATAADAGRGDTVVEVGPGEGVLTRELLALGAQVIAIEKDSRLIDLLRTSFAPEIEEGRLHLIEGDIRTVELPTKPYKVSANIPYYLTGDILRRFLTTTHKPRSMGLLMQKEVAERILTRDGKESLLSLSVQAFGTPKYVRTVKRGSFIPPPQVDSAIVSIENIGNRYFSEHFSEDTFFTILHAAFGQKRKQIGKTLTAIAPKKAVDDALADAHTPTTARPEELPLQTWLTIAKNLAPHINK